MAEDVIVDDGPGDEVAVEETARRKPGPLRWAARIVGGLLAFVLVLVAGVLVFLHTPPGRQYIVDEISKVAPASGLSVEVGRIEGSVLWSSSLYDVRFRDANGTLFLEVPEIELNWRPLEWFTSGLDVRHLVLHDGTLYAFPELNPGDPDAPLLPDFDIRVDRFVIDNLTVAEGLIGAERTVDFQAKADIREGRVLLDADGEFGGGDVFAMLVDAEPDGDKLVLDLRWNAPAGGFLAGMVGAEDDLAIALDGNGTWDAWNGELLARQSDEQLADLNITIDNGQYRAAGQVHPLDYLTGLPKQALGETVELMAMGTLENSVLEGQFMVR